MSQASAPAKVILLGEHAVVYGHPAIAVPFPALTATATAMPAERSSIAATRYPGQVALLGAEIIGDLAPAAEALRGSLEALERMGPVHPLAVTLESDIPAGAGLGSSAAIAVAIVRAAFLTHGRQAPPALVRAIATRAETLAHGASSGLDPAAVCADGPIRFERDHAPVPLTAAAPMGVVVAHTGAPSATGPMVATVRARQEADAGARATLAALGLLADQGVEAYERGQPAQLGAHMGEAHTHLRELGVSTQQLDALCHAACAAGAWGAKLTGGGGGGCAVAVCAPERLDAVARAMVAAGAASAWPSQYLPERKQEP